MARDPRDLERLAEDRARVMAEIRYRRAARPLPKGFRPPLLEASGGRWIGGDLRRDDVSGDDRGRA